LNSVDSGNEFTIRGKKFLVDTNFEENLGIYGNPFWNLIEKGGYESTTFDFIDTLTTQDFDIFIDVGAATGCMSLYAASSGLRVIAIEPQEMVFSALLKNVNLNPITKSRIALEYALVSGSKQVASISGAFTPGAAGPITSGTLTDKLITLDELLQRCPTSSKVAMKIDIEGAEFPLLTNISTMSILKSRKPLIYIALHPGFKRPLDKDSNYLTRLVWRVQAAQDVVNFYFTIFRKAEIRVASTGKQVGLLRLFAALAKDEKDYLMSFYS
jgi:FkbM family methyltransferase